MDKSVLFESLDSRIISGEPTEINRANYLVSIRYKKANNTAFEHRCAGTIYSPQIILTTASCVIGLDSRHLHVKAGSSCRTQTDGSLYVVEKYILHPDYNIWFFDNDLALVILAFPLNSNVPKQIAAIPLATNVPAENSLATIAGWGITDASINSSFSEILQIADVHIVDNSACKIAYGEGRITPGMLCAASSGTDACLGDAGGALVYRDTALGLISWGNGCGNLNFPGVYTNLIYFKEWIQSEIIRI
ncbi:hypothetical protein DOY81_001970 [Sarcophaga bullata]|nr:hypothetical protein DOY81_001970 [Sarcophaga bullata]